MSYNNLYRFLDPDNPCDEVRFQLMELSALFEVFMKAKQITLPFRARRMQPPKNPNVDLIGRSYQEDYYTVKVIGLCPNDDSRVMVRRDPGGRTWSMPAWLMRLIFMETRRRRAA